MRSGSVLPVKGITTDVSKNSKGPLANATMYEDIGGVVSYFVIFQLSFFSVANICTRLGENSATVECMISSETAGILLRLTVSARDINVTANVALRRGSSQQGKARRAEVGCVLWYVMYGLLKMCLHDPHLKLSGRVEFLLPLIFPRISEVAHRGIVNLAREGYLEFCLRVCEDRVFQLVGDALTGMVVRRG